MPKGDDGKTVRVAILNDEYKVIVCWGGEAYARKVLRQYHYPEQEGVDLSNYRGITFVRPHCFPVIALSGAPNSAALIGTLAHEAAHAIDYILTSIGEQSRGEVFAHSIGAVMRQTLRAIEKDNPGLTEGA